MLEATLYLAVFAGFYKRTGRFFFSANWPYHAGDLLAAALLRSAKEGE